MIKDRIKIKFKMQIFPFIGFVECAPSTSQCPPKKSQITCTTMLWWIQDLVSIALKFTLLFLVV